MEHNPQEFTMGERRAWYLSEEVGTALFQQRFSYIKPPTVDLVQAICNVEDNYPFGPENGIVKFITPEMLKNPRYQPAATPPPRPTEPEFSPFWTSPDCRDIPDYAIGLSV